MWSCYTCDHVIHLTILYIWLCYTCDHVIHVIMLYMWSCYTCDHVIHVIMLYIWSCYTCEWCDHVIHVIMLYMWSCYTSDYVIHLIMLYIWLCYAKWPNKKYSSVTSKLILSIFCYVNWLRYWHNECRCGNDNEFAAVIIQLAVIRSFGCAFIVCFLVWIWVTRYFVFT